MHRRAAPSSGVSRRCRSGTSRATDVRLATSQVFADHAGGDDDGGADQEEVEENREDGVDHGSHIRSEVPVA